MRLDRSQGWVAGVMAGQLFHTCMLYRWCLATFPYLHALQVLAGRLSHTCMICGLSGQDIQAQYPYMGTTIPRLLPQ